MVTVSEHAQFPGCLSRVQTAPVSSQYLPQWCVSLTSFEIGTFCNCSVVNENTCFHIMCISFILSSFTCFSSSRQVAGVLPQKVGMDGDFSEAEDTSSSSTESVSLQLFCLNSLSHRLKNVKTVVYLLWHFVNTVMCS